MHANGESIVAKNRLNMFEVRRLRVVVKKVLGRNNSSKGRKMSNVSDEKSDRNKLSIQYARFTTVREKWGAQ